VAAVLKCAIATVSLVFTTENASFPFEKCSTVGFSPPAHTHLVLAEV
jgi:hypothetical protein